MNNVIERFSGYATQGLRLVAKRRWLALSVATAVAAVCVAGLPFIPERYQASARVYVDTQTVLKPLLAQITFQPDIDQQVGMLARTLVSRPNVEQLVRSPALNLPASTDAEREKLVSRLMGEIKVLPTASGNLFDITYRGPSPERAKRLVAATVELFVHAGAGAKKRDSQDAGRFIEAQIRGYESKLTDAESRLKDFKVRNFGVSGVSSQDYFTRVSSLSDEVGKLKVELGAAEHSRDAYRRELAAEEPQLPVDPAGKVGPAAELEARLQAQRKGLDELLRRFTEEHPDVVASRRVAQQLESELRDLQRADARDQARSGKRAKAATSPVYQRLRISLAEAEAQVASLRSQLANKQASLEQTRSAAGKAPQVEAELVQLNRDYDVIRKNYELMVARRESASLGLKLDESSQLADFRVVEPPRVSGSAVFPSRLHLAAIAMALSLAAGVAAAVVAEAARPTVGDRRTLAQMSGRPVIGSVSFHLPASRALAHRAGLIRFAAACAALVVLQGAWLAWVAAASNTFAASP
jgi:polysaccharide chain length determinant protein (PEP-CTERM system associated)